MTPDPLIIPILLISLAVNALIMFAVVYLAIVHAMRRARREEFTETYDTKNATWLTRAQRHTLASREPQID